MDPKTVRGSARYTQPGEDGAIGRDLLQMDGSLLGESESVVIGQNIRTRALYRAYINRAVRISEPLLAIRPRLAAQDETLSLQQLGALSQRLVTQNADFRNSFRHGEQQLRSYRLIQTAIRNFEDAVRYWRLANHFRKTHRGSQLERDTDDEILKAKLQTALNAIDELQLLLKTREKLDQAFNAEQP